MSKSSRNPLPSPTAPLTVIVCRGSDCRGKAQERLCEAFQDAGLQVITSGCLRICKGPVAMVPAGDRWEVIPRVRGKDARKRLVEAVMRQRRKALKKRAVGGGRRRKAVAKGTARLRRVRR